MSLFDCFSCTLITGSGFIFGLFLLIFVVQKTVTTTFPIIRRHKKEKVFLNPDEIAYEEFPNIDSPPTLDLSVIVPAFNEEKRMCGMLDECLAYLEKEQQKTGATFEVIVVSDGSTDGTVSLGLKYSQKYSTNKVRVLELIENRGKGGAVRLGMLSARGRKLLFADADGATKFSDYGKLSETLEKLMENNKKMALVIGSRAHLEKEAIAVRSTFRTILMYGFHFLVWLFAVRSIRDTQCGFKLLTRSAAKALFESLHVERWAFDVELLYLAERLKIPMHEVSVNWKEIEGSKLTPFWSWLQMGIDLFLIWFRYTTGIWKIRYQGKLE